MQRTKLIIVKGEKSGHLEDYDCKNIGVSSRFFHDLRQNEVVIMWFFDKKDSNVSRIFGLIEELEFHYSIKKHGWSECKVIFSNTAIEFGVTHILSDPTCDLIDGLIKLINRENAIKIVWYEEPGSILWTISRNMKEQHKLSITLKELKNWYAGKEEDVFLEYSFEIYEDYFIKVIYCQLLKEFLLMKNKGYAKNRACNGFIEKFRELHKMLNYKI